MKTKFTFLAFLLAMISIVTFSQNCVDFESLVLGTEYGNGINTIGEVIFTENDIPVSVEYFEWVGGGGMFGTAAVTDGSTGIGTGLDVFMNNINFGFDFTNLLQVPNWVTIDFVDQGGEENLSVNGSPIYKGDIEFAALPPGISMAIDDMGSFMRLTLAGEISSLTIGGQEFTIDNVCVKYFEDPDPCVDFELLPIGAEFGLGHNPQNSWIFTENDIPVLVDYFYYSGSGGTYNTCTVIDGNPPFVTGNAMWTSNINLKFAFDNLGVVVNKVTFDFADFGGNENFSLNGGPVWKDELINAPTPPGLNMYFTDMGGYYRATIVGYVVIDSLMVGGQEFAIDNICAEHVDLYSDCVDFETLALGTMYGDGINTPGEVIFTQGVVPVSVEEFYYDGGGTTFGFGEVSNSSGIGTGQAMQLSNLNLLFDFTGYGSLPDLVTFDFADYGGHENLAIDGGAVYIGELVDAVIPGYNIGVSKIGDIGAVTIEGQIESLMVGGQEFFVDNICAHFNVGIDNPSQDKPESKASLGQNFPNPFTAQTVIPFSVTEKTHVTVAIYDHLGRQISLLTDAVYDKGEYQLQWDGSAVESGIYFYQLQTPEFVQTRKLIVNK